MMTTESKIVAWGEHSIAWVQSKDPQEALNLLQNGEVDGLGLSPHNGFASENISFLAHVPNLKGLVLPYAEKYDIKVLEQVPTLRFLTVAGNNQAFDYSAVPELEELRIEWHSKLELPSPASKLRSLYIRDYKSKLKNLLDLPPYENVKELEINQGNLTSLKGIERLRKLSIASFFHLRQLHSIVHLVEINIERLHIEGCKKVSDVESLIRCRELISFRLIDCGKLNSLRFLEGFEKLEEFRFVNTIIQDGDMTPLLRMKSVGFLKRSSYSHTPEEIREAIGAK
jgi:hypothetical protein